MRSINLTSACFIILVSALALTNCQSEASKTSFDVPPDMEAREFSVYPMKTPSWFRNAILFYVDFNDGQLQSFAQLESTLPQLKEAGITTIVLSQVYASDENGHIVDYTKVNPDLGTFEDFQRLTRAIRKERLQSVLVWDMQQPSPQHVWHDSNPQWFSATGDFDFEHANLQTTLLECMKFWLRAGEIGGFWTVHTEVGSAGFWQRCRPELDAIKPVLMLTDAIDAVEHHQTCFEVSSGKEHDDLLGEVITSQQELQSMLDHYKRELPNYPATYNRFRMITRPAESSHSKLKLGLQVLMDGVPVYTDLDQLISEGTYVRTLNLLKQYNKALRNVDYEQRMEMTAVGSSVLLIKRVKEGQQVNILANISDREATFIMPESLRVMSDLMTKNDRSFREGEKYTLAPHQLVVLPNPSVEI